MNYIIEHAGHLMHYDGVLHWCFLIALYGFFISIMWVIVRVLLPLRRLVILAEGITHGNLASFAEPIRGITEIDRLRIRLHEMMLEIEAGQEREYIYRNALTDSQEHERMRIAHEIHDDTIQSLVLVAHHIERATLAITHEKDLLLLHLKNARCQLLESIERLRGLIANLRPTLLDELGLVTTIESLCETYPTLDFQVQGDIYEINYAHELALFRAAQEAIRNAEKYAQAQRISAILIYTKTEVMLKVYDDGIGFNVPHQFQQFAIEGHYGLLGIQERVRHLGGDLKLRSQRGMGTSIEVSFPFEFSDMTIKNEITT